MKRKDLITQINRAMKEVSEGERAKNTKLKNAEGKLKEILGQLEAETLIHEIQKKKSKKKGQPEKMEYFDKTSAHRSAD